MERVRWPLICMATCSDTPARTMLRTAVRRRSWNSIPSSPAAVQTVAQAFRRSPIGEGALAVKYVSRQLRTARGIASSLGAPAFDNGAYIGQVELAIVQGIAPTDAILRVLRTQPNDVV